MATKPNLEAFLARATRNFLSEAREACTWLLMGLLFTCLLTILYQLTSGQFSKKQPGQADAGWAGMERWLATTHDRGVLSLRGAFFGLISPLCSCGALPIASGLLRIQTPLPAVVSFLVASQGAGLDSAVFTYGSLGFSSVLAPWPPRPV
eukprot:g23847.t1